jgi:hypothetical protein
VGSILGHTESTNDLLSEVSVRVRVESRDHRELRVQLNDGGAVVLTRHDPVDSHACVIDL